MRELNCIYPDPMQASSIRVGFSLEREELIARFEVQPSGTTPNVNAKLPLGASQWGLWDWDVVEIFVRPSSSPTYYEFQLSPLGQFFELEIFEPRKRFNREFKSGFGHSVQTLGAGWRAEFRIPLRELGWDGNPKHIVGNAFAILDDKPRTYWSLYLPKQTKPDFHLPEYFQPFF
jgi:hypothetical protein